MRLVTLIKRVKSRLIKTSDLILSQVKVDFQRRGKKEFPIETIKILLLANIKALKRRKLLIMMRKNMRKRLMNQQGQQDQIKGSIKLTGLKIGLRDLSKVKETMVQARLMVRVIMNMEVRVK